MVEHQAPPCPGGALPCDAIPPVALDQAGEHLVGLFGAWPKNLSKHFGSRGPGAATGYFQQRYAYNPSKIKKFTSDYSAQGYSDWFSQRQANNTGRPRISGIAPIDGKTRVSPLQGVVGGGTTGGQRYSLLHREQYQRNDANLDRITGYMQNRRVTGGGGSGGVGLGVRRQTTYETRAEFMARQPGWKKDSELTPEELLARRQGQRMWA